MNRLAGKIHWIVAVGLLGILVIVGFVFRMGETPASAGTKFMDAFARGDAKALTELSYAPGESPESLQKKWEHTLNVAAKHYVFRWQTKGEQVINDQQANYLVMLDRQQGYLEPFELPMVKENGRWKIAIYEVDRTMLPGLPRAD